MFGIERAILLYLKGKRRHFFRLLESWTITTTNIFEKNDLLLNVDGNDGELESDSQDHSYQNEEEEEFDVHEFYPDDYDDEFWSNCVYNFPNRLKQQQKEGKSSWNSLHHRMDCVWHFYNSYEENEVSWNEFLEDCKKDMIDNPHLLKEHCSVTGATPLMIFWFV